VGKSGADGLLGRNTIGATHDFCEDFGFVLVSEDVIPDPIHNAALRLAKARQAPIQKPAKFLDLTDVAARGWIRSTRPWEATTGITLHNTGCPLPDISDEEADYFRHTGRLDSSTPKLNRWAKHPTQKLADGSMLYTALKAHFGITYSGWILQIYPLNAFGWHAQGLSHDTIGFEIAGFMFGIEGDESTRPSGPDGWSVRPVTDAQVAACEELIAWIDATLAANGSKLKGMFAHRQAAPNGSRRPDPGSGVWQRVGLPAIAKYGLSDGGPGYVRGKGLPIPEAWDPSRKGIDY
jgi:hypothetical protein